MRGVPPVCQNWAWHISCGTLVDVHVLQKLLINPFLADVSIAFHSGSSYLNITFRRILIIKFCYQFGAPKLIIILPQKSLGSGYPSYSTRYLYPPTLDRKPFLRGLYTDLMQALDNIHAWFYIFIIITFAFDLVFFCSTVLCILGEFLAIFGLFVCFMHP